MSIFSRLFKKSAARGINRFDQIQQMTTRPLPIPGLPESSKEYLIIKAERQKTGHWTLCVECNVNDENPSVFNAKRVLEAIAARHMQTSVKSVELRREYLEFDTAFKIMRETEETLLKHCGFLPDQEPRHHFMHAYRLLPNPFQEEIDTSYFQNLSQYGWLLSEADNLTLRRSSPKNGV